WYVLRFIRQQNESSSFRYERPYSRLKDITKVSLALFPFLLNYEQAVGAFRPYSSGKAGGFSGGREKYILHLPCMPFGYVSHIRPEKPQSETQRPPSQRPVEPLEPFRVKDCPASAVFLKAFVQGLLCRLFHKGVLVPQDGGCLCHIFHGGRIYIVFKQRKNHVPYFISRIIVLQISAVRPVFNAVFIAEFFYF